MATNIFATEYRLFAGISAFCQLLQPMTAIRAYSGAKRLYLMTGLGVTFVAAGDLARLEANLAQDGSLIEPPTAFVRRSIIDNCRAYNRMLGELILRRLATRGTQDVPSDGGLRPRLSYNITPHLVQQINKVLNHKSNWGRETTWQNLADMAQIEYAHVAQVKGHALPNPRQDDTLRTYIECLEALMLFDIDDTTDPRMLFLPVLITTLVIARLLFADFTATSDVPPIGPLGRRLWLSDSTLAAMPWPSPEFVKGFVEPDAGMITTNGWRYLNLISAVYPDQMSSVA